MTPTCFSCFLRYLYVMWNLVAKFVLPPAWAGSVECPPVKMHWCRRMCLSRTACWLTMILCFAVCLQCIKMPELKFSAFCAYEGLGWKELSVFDVGRSKGYLFCSVLLLSQLRKLWLAKCIRVKSVWYLPIVEQLPTGDPQEHRLHVMVDGEIMPSGSVTKCLCFIITITRNYWMPTEGLWPPCNGPQLLLSCIRRVCFGFPSFRTASYWFSASLHFSSHLLVALFADEHSSKGAHWLLASKDSTTLAKPVARSQSPKWWRLRSVHHKYIGWPVGGGKKEGSGWDWKGAPFTTFFFFFNFVQHWEMICSCPGGSPLVARSSLVGMFSTRVRHLP